MDLKEDLVRYYHWLRQYNLNDSHSGNASVRDGDSVWVTPTSACADTLCADDLKACSMNGELTEGASQDAALHVAIYQHQPKATAILHSHCPHAVALTLNGQDYIPADFEGQLYFPVVPVLSINYQDYFTESRALIPKSLAKHPITIMRGHGVYCCAENLELAYKWTCSLELSAKIAFIAKQAGTL